MRKLFNIPAERETRLWNKYMSNTYEQLSKLDNTVQDAGLYQGQVGGPRRAPADSSTRMCSKLEGVLCLSQTKTQADGVAAILKVYN